MDRQPRQSPAIMASCLLAAFLGSGVVQAQSTPPTQRPPAPTQTPAPNKPSKPDPARDPALSDPNLDDDASGKRRPTAPPAVPVANPPAVPGTAPAAKPAGPIPPTSATGATGPSIPKGTLLPEGTFLSGRPGAIVKTPGGMYIFVPSDASPGMAKATPMVLQWNQRLSQVAAAIEGSDAAAASVSGQAFVYKGRQYLLLSVFSMTRNTDIAKPAPGTQPATPDANADVRELIEQLDSRPSAPRAMDQRILTTEPTAVRGVKDTVIAEGTVITARRARLVRGPGGLTVTFDNGPGNAGLPPMQLLPCRLLEQLESLAASRGENLTIRLSGRTTVHGGLNYLLPTMYQVIRPGDLRPIQ